jgi:general secretion pathway protein A
MYLEYYGLRELPFELTTHPGSLYLTARHREALSNLQYGLAAAKTLTVLTGEPGTGKTTLLRAALSSDRCCQVRGVYLNNPALTRSEFFEVLASGMGFGASAAQSKAALLEELERVLCEGQSRGEVTALVVDEAQSLSTDLLEEIRLLANLEAGASKLLPIVLVGQPDFAVRLEDHGLRALKQRVVLRCETTPFDLAETAVYIASRIRNAGGEAIRLFTREAVLLIHEYSNGIPRTISVICDNALVHGLALRQQPVQQDIVREVCRDFKLADPAPEHAGSPMEARGGANGPPPADPRLPEQPDQEARDEAGEQSGQVVAPRRFRLFASRR